MTKKTIQPAELELQILQVLWRRGPCTVREVLESINGDKVRAYTTILSTMQVMERKKLLRRKGTVSGAILYASRVDKQHVIGSALRQMLLSIFGGRPLAVVQHLLSEELVDANEIAEIRKMLDEHEHQETSELKNAAGRSKRGIAESDTSRPNQKMAGNARQTKSKRGGKR